jgi:hypothetical protein
LDFELTKSRDGLLIAVPTGNCAKFSAGGTKRELLVYIPKVKQPSAQKQTPCVEALIGFALPGPLRKIRLKLRSQLTYRPRFRNR